MSRRKSIKLGLICSLLSLLVGFSAWADTKGGATPRRNGQTEVQIGVVVNYMEKLRLVVLEQETQKPIPGASVEIYIPALARYVLSGLTDENGICELDVACNMDLSSNRIRYRVYKAGWHPYPSIGETRLKTTEILPVITVYLHKQKTGGNDSNAFITPVIIPRGSTAAGKPSFDGMIESLYSIPDFAVWLGNRNSGAIPKTGMEGTVHYWLLGFVFFLMAGGIVWILLKKDKESNEGERDLSSDRRE